MFEIGRLDSPVDICSTRLFACSFYVTAALVVGNGDVKAASSSFRLATEYDATASTVHLMLYGRRLLCLSYQTDCKQTAYRRLRRISNLSFAEPDIEESKCSSWILPGPSAVRLGWFIVARRSVCMVSSSSVQVVVTPSHLI